MEREEAERVADSSDRATLVELGANEEAVLAARSKVPDPNHRAEECADCGGDVEPPERREAGYTTCIYCAERKERAGKRV